VYESYASSHGSLCSFSSPMHALAWWNKRKSAAEM